MYNPAKDLHDVARSLRGILATKTRDLREGQYDPHFLQAKKALAKYDDAMKSRKWIRFNRDDVMRQHYVLRTLPGCSSIPIDVLDQMRDVLLQSIEDQENGPCAGKL